MDDAYSDLSGGTGRHRTGDDGGGAVRTLGDVTFAMMLREARREVGMRHGVYSKRVKTGEMTEAEADRLILVMQAIVEHLKPLAALEEQHDEPGLFEGGV